jgi:hypothetical protein
MRNSRGILVGSLILGGLVVTMGRFAEPVVAQVRAALVKDVDNGARQPFAAQAAPPFLGSSSNATGTFLTVPAGKRGVIEHFSCVNYASAGNTFIRLELRFVTAGLQRQHEFVATNTGPSFVAGVDVWTVSQPVRAYADPETAIQLTAVRRVPGTDGVECYITGHFVDLTP